MPSASWKRSCSRSPRDRWSSVLKATAPARLRTARESRQCAGYRKRGETTNNTPAELPGSPRGQSERRRASAPKEARRSTRTRPLARQVQGPTPRRGLLAPAVAVEDSRESPALEQPRFREPNARRVLHVHAPSCAALTPVRPLSESRGGQLGALRPSSSSFCAGPSRGSRRRARAAILQPCV